MDLLKKLKKNLWFWLGLFLLFATMSYFLNHDTARFCIGKYCAQGYAQEHFLFSIMIGALVTLITFAVIFIRTDGIGFVYKGIFKIARRNPLFLVPIIIAAIALLLFAA